MSAKRDNRGFISSIHPIDGDENNGFKFTIYLPDPSTTKLRQVTRQSRHWNYFDAEKEYLMMEYMGKNYFTQQNKTEKPKPKRLDDDGKKYLIMDEVFEKYLEAKETEIRDSYIDTMRINYNAHIKEHFKYFYMPAITQQVIDKWKVELNRKYAKNSTSIKLSSHTKNQIITILRSIFEFALEKNYIERPLKISRIKQPKRRKEMKVRAHWESQDWYKFLESIPTDNLRDLALFHLMFSTGARISEIRGLHESAFNFRKNQITISTNLIRRKRKEGFTTYVEGDTKGSDERLIELNSETIDIIKNLVEVRKEEEGKNYHSKKTFLFSIKGSDPISPTSAARRFNEYKKIALKNYPELNPDVTLHGLRHSVGTYVANEIGVVEAQKMLGHADLATTSGYVHKSNNTETAKSIGFHLRKQVTNE